jgi:AcrR family transcriptional regulator
VGRSAKGVQPEDGTVRERIVVEATRQFAAAGFAAVPLQAVADAVGVAKPTVVYHFGTKEGLQAAVLDALVGHWRSELPRQLAAAATGGPRLESLLRALFGFFLEDRNRARLALRAMIDTPAEMRSLLAEALRPWTRLLGEAIRSGQAAGTVRREVDPEAYALLVTTSAIGVIAAGELTSAMFDPEPSLDAQLAELVRVARIGLLTPRSEPEA